MSEERVMGLSNLEKEYAPKIGVRYRFALLNGDEMEGTVVDVLWRTLSTVGPNGPWAETWDAPKVIRLLGDSGERILSLPGEFSGERKLRWEAVAWFAEAPKEGTR